MAGTYKTLESYVLATRITASLFMILVYSWIAIYPFPDVGMKWLAFGLGTIFAVSGLAGLWKLRRAVFLSANLALAAIHILSVIGTALTTIQDVLAASLLVLIVIFLAELGGSSILYSRIVRGIREPTDEEVTSRTKKAMSRHLIDAATIVVTAFSLSCALLLLGSMSIPTAMPSYIVAAEIAVLLVGIVLLGPKRGKGRNIKES
ncbi:MAG: hypothetical protein OEZ24_01705 [Candidatus Bathyarchaeota archaeon]|nr:hypothetical protein [Candidatus Bathyarchaeota archaeon]